MKKIKNKEEGGKKLRSGKTNNNEDSKGLPSLLFVHFILKLFVPKNPVQD